jgi:drug/metabolite transporter (DMT)-like permease
LQIICKDNPDGVAPMSQFQRRKAHGIALKLASVALFVVMQSLVKVTAPRVPPGEAVFFRSICALPVILAWIALRGQLRLGLWPQAPVGHLWRGVLGTVSMGLGFAGLAYLPLTEVTALGYAAPLMVVIFAAMFLNERVPPLGALAVLLGLAGVLVVLLPRVTVFGGAGPNRAETLGAALVLGCAILAALAQISVRKLLVTDRTPVIVFWFSVTGSVLALVTVPFGWVRPSVTDAAALIASGIVGACAQILMTESYRHAPASTIAPLDYSSLLFAILIGFVLFGETPGQSLLLGAPLIIGAGLLVSLGRRKGSDDGV